MEGGTIIIPTTGTLQPTPKSKGDEREWDDKKKACAEVEVMAQTGEQAHVKESIREGKAWNGEDKWRVWGYIKMMYEQGKAV